MRKLGIALGSIVLAGALGAPWRQETPPSPAQTPPPAPAAAPASGAPERPAVTRQWLQVRLDAIAKGATRLRELAVDDEQRQLAQRIAWLARDTSTQLEAVSPAEAPAAQAAGDGQGAAGEGAPLEPLELSGERADPARWRPVKPARTVQTLWGTNLQEAAQKSGSRRFVGEHHLAVSSGAAVLSTHYNESRGFTFQECILEGAPAADGRLTTRWGVRAYDVIDWRFEHCEWRNIPDEHGCYLSAPGSVLWSQCKFEGIGSQAIQVVYRTDPAHVHETSNPALREVGGLQQVVECLFLECGKPSGGRPAYALSFFEGPRCDVRIERCYIQTRESHHLDHLGMPSSSYGAIMVHDRPRVEILDTFVDYRRPDRAVIQIWNVEEVVIQGCEIPEGEIEIRNCGRVLLRGNKGGARVVIGTGPAYSWPMPHVVHEGPLERDVSL
jgi:hypothetical protein